MINVSEEKNKGKEQYWNQQNFPKIKKVFERGVERGYNVPDNISGEWSS